MVVDISQHKKLTEKEDSKVGVAADNHQPSKLTEEDNFEEGVEVELTEKEDSKVGVAAERPSAQETNRGRQLRGRCGG